MTKRNEITNNNHRELGMLIGFFAKSEADQIIMHDDVSAWHAPSECHDDVSKGHEIEWKGMEDTFGTFESLMKRIDDLGMNSKRIYENAVGRIYKRDCPFK